MPYYSLNLTFKESIGEQEAHDLIQELGISICIDLVDAHGSDDTFEAMVFGTTVLGPKQGSIKIQVSRPLEFLTAAACMGALSAEDNISAAFWSEEGGTPMELIL